MALNHLHLHVRDRSVAENFYSSWFGMHVQRQLDEITFMTDEQEFLLALMHDPGAAPLPPWFHFGFRQPSSAAVIAMNAAMVAAGIPIKKAVHRDESLVSFRCADPDGQVIEVFWEASRDAA
jgi:catechol-2,3-dioxygenase